MEFSRFIPRNQYRYYYLQLDDGDKELYRIMLNGFLEFKPWIFLKNVREYSKLKRIYEYICLDIPEIFYIKRIWMEQNVTEKKCILKAEYRFGLDECVNIMIEIQNKTRTFLYENSTKNEIDKEKAIHDFIVNNVQYKDVNAPYSHEMPGFFLYGIGVCEGISKTFKYLADRLGINSVIAVGKILNEPYNLHAWNVAKIDNIFYHIDVTFDFNMSVNGVNRYDYFNLADYEINDRRMEGKLPICNKSGDYYKSHGNYANSNKELKQILKNKLDRDHTVVVQIPMFKAANDILMNELLKTAISAISDKIHERYQISIYPNNERRIYGFAVE